jgi:8-oxo-dGTP pyrophosphatase MutT (NUDIX family)
MTAAQNASVVRLHRERRKTPQTNFLQLSELRELRDCEQVAAVCYRVRRQTIEFLLVRTRGGRRWTFPKGGAEPGLTHAQAAALEAFEEAGVRGRIEEASFARYASEKLRGRGKGAVSRRRSVTINAHLCEVLRLVTPKELGRDRTWFAIKEAKERLQKGRTGADAAEFTRIVDAAVACIERSYDDPATDITQILPPQRGQSRDALQAVQFEAATQIHGRKPWTEFVPNKRVGATRSTAFPVEQPQKLLPAVLQFNTNPAANQLPKCQPEGRKTIAQAPDPTAE